MQEQMSSVNDLGEFQEVESNIVEDCLTFPVNQKRFQVLLPCWAATNACHLIHGMHLDYRKTFLLIKIFYVWFTRDHPQGVHSCASQRERGSVLQATGSKTLFIFTRDNKQSGDTIPMPIFARRPSTMSSLIPVEMPQNSMVGQQRQQISELQFDKFPTSQSFFSVEMSMKKPRH